MKYESWKSLNKVETEFLKSMNKIVKMLNRIAKLSGDNQQKYIDEINDFQNSKSYNSFVYSSVKRMVTAVTKYNYSTWRKAARERTKSRFIYSTLMDDIQIGLNLEIARQIEENANLIKTLPSDTAHKVVNDIAEYALSGLRASKIAELIKDKTDQHARASAKLIARTEVSKTTTALTEARSKAINIDWYVWRTARDGNRVRPSHRNMEGVLVNWNNPPSPEMLIGEPSVGTYHAGNIWNCRCYPEPLIDINDIHWPAKVYINGEIIRMGKKEFENMLNLKIKIFYGYGNIK